jgi:hypothetical protein
LILPLQVFFIVTAISSEKSDIQFTWMSSFVHKDIIYMNMCDNIWRSPSVFSNVAVWKWCTLKNSIFQNCNIYYSEPVNITGFI